jgi:hypothetical protein
MIGRLSRIAPTIAFAVTAACSDSTGPASVARHLDTLYRQACAHAYVPLNQSSNTGYYDTASVYYQRCQLLSVLLAGPASGAEPSRLNVTTGAGRQTWRGIVISEYDTLSTGAPETTINTMIAYSDANVTTAVVSFVTNAGNFVYIIANDTITENGASLSATTSRSSLGAPCQDTPGLANPLLADTLTGFPPIEYGGNVCHLATFSASLSATFPATAGLDPSLQSITIDAQSVNGISVIPNYFYFDRARSGR